MKRRMTQSPPTDGKPKAKSNARSGRAKTEPARERPRIGGPRAIADLMPNIGGAAFRKFGFVQSSIVSRWAEIAGPRHAALSAPESIRFPPGKKAGGTLHLVVASGHAPILQHVVPDLIARVNRFFGYEAVTKIAIRQGEVQRAEPADRPPPRMLKPMPVEMGEGLREIGDPELRAVLEALASGVAGSAPPPRIG